MINRKLTEDQMKDAYQAITAIQIEKGHNEAEAKKTANLLVYGAFRNLYTYDSLITSIVNSARSVFSH